MGTRADQDSGHSGRFSLDLAHTMNKNTATSHMIQLRLSVRDVKPEIWRKLLVPSDITLERLHAVLQVVMGWQNRHLYAFVANEKRYSPPNEDDDGPKNRLIKTKLSILLDVRTSAITYEYDFGDGWEIDIRNETGSGDLLENHTTRCTEGSRHGPAEDTGGSRGYMEKVRIYGNPQHKRYLEVRKLIGPNFDPEAFDLIQTNEMLKEI
jgi:hypothetical protein